MPPSQVGEAGLEVEVAPLEDEDGEDVADNADGAADRQQETLEPELLLSGVVRSHGRKHALGST